MIELFKEENKKSHKEIQENANKHWEKKQIILFKTLKKETNSKENRNWANS